MTPRPSEVKAIAALLQEGAETPEALAKQVIAEVDRLRTDRKTFMVVAQYQAADTPWYLAYGPYATAKQAEKATAKGLPIMPPAKVAVVPTYNPGHAETVWADTDKPAAPKGDFARVARDAQAYREGRKPER